MKIYVKHLLISLLLIGYSFANEVEDLIEKSKQNIDEKQVKKVLDKAKENIQNKQLQSKAEETINQFHKNMDHLIEKWKQRIDYDEETGKLIIRGTVKDNLGKQKSDIQVGIGENKFLQPTDRIYIFISSSIPKEVLIEYAKQIVDLGLENRAVMVIRGCIGGCKYIKPTLKWLSSILHEDGKNKQGLPVAIWIDPLLFRMYQIKEVPCVVFAENVVTENIELSEGLKYNLKTKPQAIISCGDWSLGYHLKQLYEKTKNPKLKTILALIKNRGFYYGNQTKNQRENLHNKK